MLNTQVLIIGGGATGTGIARDLALRGVQSILVERRDINAGASGANHGLLHSGGRYVSSDQGSAVECRQEAELLKKLAPHCIEDTGGLFVAVEGDDEKFVADFPHLCSQCDITVQALGVKEARELEPVLSDKLIAAYKVADASIDPFKLSMENISQAQELGSTLLRFTKVVGFEKSDKKIRTTVQFKVVGEAPGVEEGGILEHIMWDLEVEGFPLDIPDFIEVDASELNIGDSLSVGSLTVPESVTVLSDAGATVITVAAPRVEEEVVEEELEEGIEGEEPEVIGDKPETEGEKAETQEDTKKAGKKADKKADKEK